MKPALPGIRDTRARAEWYRAYVTEHWRAPTVREFADAAGIRSSSDAQAALKQLVGLGLIRRRVA